MGINLNAINPRKTISIVTINRTCFIFFALAILPIVTLGMMTNNGILSGLNRHRDSQWVKTKEDILIHTIQGVLGHNNLTVEKNHHLQMFHGFGSNVYSFQPLLEALNQCKESIPSNNITYSAHDIPGFGQSQKLRTSRLYKMYRTLWNARFASDLCESNKNSDDLHRIIIGHSMGCAPAIISCALSDQPVTLVLISPAIKTKSTLSRLSSIECMDTILTELRHCSDSIIAATPTQQTAQSANTIDTVQQALATPFRAMLSFFAHSNIFWANGLKYTIHDSTLITHDLVQRHKFPSEIPDFEYELLRFVYSQGLSSLHEGNYIGESFPSSMAMGNVTLIDLLDSLIATNRVEKVILIHGEKDKLIPCKTSRQIFDILTETKLKYNSKTIIQYYSLSNIGHVAHEENPTVICEILLQSL